MKTCKECGKEVDPQPQPAAPPRVELIEGAVVLPLPKNIADAAERLKQVRKNLEEEDVCWLSRVYDKLWNKNATSTWQEDLKLVSYHLINAMLSSPNAIALSLPPGIAAERVRGIVVEREVQPTHWDHTSLFMRSYDGTLEMRSGAGVRLENDFEFEIHPVAREVKVVEKVERYWMDGRCVRDRSSGNRIVWSVPDSIWEFDPVTLELYATITAAALNAADAGEGK